MRVNYLQRPGPSAAELASELEEADLDAILEAESDGTLEALLHDWGWWGRPAQHLPPGTDWFVWLVQSGRGFGKTRTGAETIRRWIEDVPVVLIAGETAYDVRETMIEGEAGILNVGRPEERPHYESSKRRLTWPNGARGLCLGLGEEPDLARGPQYYRGWLDELAKWKYAEDAYEQISFGMRLGDHPQMVITTTPRPRKVIRDLLKDPLTIVTKASSLENLVNLSPVYIKQVITPKIGTRIGRQEIEAELLDDVPGALWKREQIEYRPPPLDGLLRIVVAIDPAATSSDGANETGIVAAGRGSDDRGYVLADRSGRLTPLEWGKRAVLLYDELGADRIVYETNQGGEMIPAVIEMAAHALGVPTPALTGVHASRGKQTRAEPISAIYEQHRASHVEPFELLEDQLCTWVPEDESPDRLDALVWAMTELFIGRPTAADPDDVALLRGSSMHG